MRRLVIIFVLCLAAAGILYAQVSDRLGVQDMRYGKSWNRDLGTSTVLIHGITPINVQGFPFFARGDDSSNDEDAIQAAIDSAYSWGGGVVYLPAGTYYVGGSGAADSVDSWCLRLKSNVTIMGDGNATKIKMFTQKGRDVQPNGYPQAHVFYSGKRTWYYPTASSGQTTGERVYEDLIDTTHTSTNGEIYPSNIEIRDLCIDTDYANQPSGGTHNYSPINVWSATNVRVINCRLTGGVAETAYFFGNHPDSSTTNIIFSGNIVEETGEWGVDALGVHFDRVDGVSCTNNVFKTIGLRAIGVGKAWNVLVDGNEIRGVYDVGIRCVGGNYVTISNNHMYNINQYGVEVSNEGTSESFGVVVTGNNIALNDNNGEAGVMVKNSQRVHVDGNMVQFVHWDGNDSATSYVGGIYVLQTDTLAAGGPWLKDVTVTNNAIFDIDDIYDANPPLADTLAYAPAAIQFIDIIGTFDSRPDVAFVGGNYSNYSFDGFRISNFDTVISIGNMFGNVVRTGLDTTNVGWMSSVSYFTTAGYDGASGRDSTGTKSGYEFTSPGEEP